jgi:hypothetical protein
LADTRRRRRSTASASSGGTSRPTARGTTTRSPSVGPASSRRPVATPAARTFPLRAVVLGVVAVGLAAFIGLGFISQATAKSYACGEILQPPSSVPPEGIDVPDMGHNHVAVGTKITYATCPPTSGQHYSAPGAGPIRPGFYGPDSKAEPGGWVHNLEHGYIVVLYRGDIGAADLAAVQRFVDLSPATAIATACGYRAKIVVARFDDMATPFSVLAWDRLLPLRTWDQGQALAFAQRWVETAAGAAGREPNGC